jgi:hypothetical protein
MVVFMGSSKAVAVSQYVAKNGRMAPVCRSAGNFSRPCAE